MLKATVISRDSATPANGVDVIHTIAGGEYSGAPTLATDGFALHATGGSSQFDAYEMAYSFTGGDATSTVTIRPWYYINIGGALTWVDGKLFNELPAPGASTDVKAAAIRLNSVPVYAVRMYCQIVAQGGTAITSLDLRVYGIEGNVANVNSDIEVTLDGTVTLGAVEIEDGPTTDKARVVDANAVHAPTDHVLLVQNINADGEVIEGGASGVGGGAAIYSVGQNDFTAAYTAATQITLAGGITGLLSEVNFIKVTQFQNADVAVDWLPTDNQFTYNPATGVLTVASAAFAATDTFDVLVWYTPKSYDIAGNQDLVWRNNPDWEQQTSSTLLNLSGIATNTTGYGYIDLQGYRYAIIQGVTAGAAPTDVLTVTLEAAVQDDGTAPGAITSWVDVTSALTGVASWVDTDFLVIIDTPLLPRYLRVKYVTSNDSGDDCDLTVYTRLSW